MMWLQQKRAGLGSTRLWIAVTSWWADFKKSPIPIGSARSSVTAVEQTPVIKQTLRSQGLWSGAWSDHHACESNYWATSTAPAETLWQLVTNLADLSTWHPLITATNAPRGQRATPGLIYRAVMPYLPISTQIFVERVLPGELLSIRLFPLPGLQERVTYRIVSTLCGTCVLYTITLSGWLSPLAWPMIKPHATKVAAALVEAAEQHMSGTFKKTNKTDIFGSPI
jgi:Polyketide cyclase / dehydrase and lipid transport